MRAMICAVALTFLTTTLLGWGFPMAASGQTITFETLPDGTVPTDNMLISDQYNVDPYWVTFELIGVDPSVGPRIAKVGPPETAFRGPPDTASEECDVGVTNEDMPVPDQGVGCFFLTDDGVNQQSTQDLLITYANPVNQASGVLMDIQPCCESWHITALGSDMSVIATIDLSWEDPEAGDGVATPWEFDVAQDIHFIKLEYTGDYDHAVGLAFDNFSPSSVSPVEERSWGEVKSDFR